MVKSRSDESDPKLSRTRQGKVRAARSKIEEKTVAEEDPKGNGPFDVTTVRALVGLMGRFDLSEIDLREGQQRIRIRRGALKTTVAAFPPVASMSAPVAASEISKGGAADEPTASAKKLIEIKSPTPGTYYARSSPEAEPFVKVGSRVESKTVVCLIEAMKLYTEIQAECAGVITEILVENTQPVEFDQVLFRVDPTG